MILHSNFAFDFNLRLFTEADLMLAAYLTHSLIPAWYYQAGWCRLTLSDPS
jgi:hypothetical protein